MERSGAALFVPDITHRVQAVGFHHEVKSAAERIAVRLGQDSRAQVQRSGAGAQLESIVAADSETMAAGLQFEIGQVLCGDEVLWAIQTQDLMRDAVIIIPIQRLNGAVSIERHRDIASQFLLGADEAVAVSGVILGGVVGESAQRQ